MLPRIEQPRLALGLSVAGALSFWLPDVAIHIVDGNQFAGRHVAAITLALPIAFLFTYLNLRRVAAHRGYRSPGIPMVLGVWLLGGVFMVLSSLLGGGFAGANQSGTLFMFVLFSWVPPLTWILATYDGSLLALLAVTVVALVVWSIRANRADLLEHGCIAALLIVGWFALTSVTHNATAQVALGWIGFALLLLYFRWLQKNKLHPPTR